MREEKKTVANFIAPKRAPCNLCNACNLCNVTAAGGYVKRKKETPVADQDLQPRSINTGSVIREMFSKGGIWRIGKG